MGIAKLSTFIRDNTEAILSEWEAFARSLPQGPSMDVRALRAHARAMLEEIAADIDAPQTEREQSDKSKGLRDGQQTSSRAAAIEHGNARAVGGFSVLEMVAEFRALRASVVRLWIGQATTVTRAELEQLTRFNEAIDQSVAESLERYMCEVDETRERFLAILSHDLRNPLGAISTSASFLAESTELSPEQSKIVTAIGGATKRMTTLIADMLELALSRLGDGMPVRRSPMDVGDLVRDVAGEILASYTRASVEISTDGELRGSWDGARLAQALTNIVANAVQHGDTARPIRIVAHGDDAEVTVEVRNSGRTIPRDRLSHLFTEPMRSGREQHDGSHLGLGLYIADKIVEGHGGSIDVRSENSETAFTMRLPRAGKQKSVP